MQQLKSGLVLANRYTLVRKLGNGAGTEVWLAGDRMTGANVALKILVDDAIDGALLRREWQTSIRLMHPHIVRVFEYHAAADTTPGADFYSLQYLDGPGIAELTGATPDKVLPPIALLADALRYAHSKSVVHRDIKAGNVLLDHNGAPYLIDFGVAANRGTPGDGGSLIAATPASLAGEAASPADDIFAFGGLIYELVSGRSPYPSGDVAKDIREHIPDPLCESGGEAVAPAIAALVASMLHKDAEARPDAAAVATALRDAGVVPGPAPVNLRSPVREIRDEVIDARAAPKRHDVADLRPAVASNEPQTGLRPRTVGIALAVLVLMLIAVVFLLPQSVSTRDPGESAEVVEPESDAAQDADEEALPERDERVQDREATEAVLGELLAKIKTLESRAVERWGGVGWRKASEEYQAGDEAYLRQDYATATRHYETSLESVDPLLERVDKVFTRTLTDAEQALQAGDSAEALRLFELAVAITPAHGKARAGYLRAQNLDQVLTLTDQGLAHERQQEFSAARESFARAIEVDPLWQPASDGLQRVDAAILQNSFDARMSEGHMSLAAGDYIAARAAFRMARELLPNSSAPDDGLLQVEQGLRLQGIAGLESKAAAEVAGEQWQAAAETFEALLELDDSLAFAHDGLARSRQMIAVHKQLDDYIQAPDSLSADATMQRATNLVLDITRMDKVGPRLAAQRDDLSRLLKRAATPLTVQLVSDNMTNVSVYRVAKLGTFESTELSLRPGTYVAVGSRPGYRDVRLEFRVAPEIDMQPVVVRCEEMI